MENDMASHISQLYMFMKEGRNEKAISMIENIEPNRLFQYDRDLLHRAVEYDNLVVAEYLVDNGWDLDASNVYGKYLLEIAMERRNIDVISMLSSRLLDMMEKNSIIDKHIKLTQPRWPNDLKVIKELLYNLTCECFNKKQIAEKLLQLNCPLAAAVCVFRDAELTKLMLDADCSVDGRLVSTGETGLHLAVEYCDIDNVRLLLDRGAKVDATDDMGFTPISRININVRDKSVGILKLLLNHGAFLIGTFSKRRSSGWHSDGPAKIIMNKILQEGDEQMLRMVTPYIDLCHKDMDGLTPLHHLVNSRNQYSLEILRGKSVDANVPDINGWTPRDIAVSRALYEKLRFLLEHGASPNNCEHDDDVALRRLLYNVFDSEKAKNVFELLLLYNMNLEPLVRNDRIFVAFVSAMKDLDFAKSVLAHLAKLESLALNTLFTGKINLNEHLQNYFNACKREIEEMKMTILYGAVSLYKLLTENGKRLTRYARNEEFLLHYEFFKSNEYFICPYYVKSIKLRVDKAIALANMKSKAAKIICQITMLPKSMVVTIAHIIVDYLNQKDIENVIKICSSVTKIQDDNGQSGLCRSN